jgi:hypothetical protein
MDFPVSPDEGDKTGNVSISSCGSLVLSGCVFVNLSVDFQYAHPMLYDVTGNVFRGCDIYISKDVLLERCVFEDSRVISGGEGTVRGSLFLGGSVVQSGREGQPTILLEQCVLSNAFVDENAAQYVACYDVSETTSKPVSLGDVGVRDSQDMVAGIYMKLHWTFEGVEIPEHIRKLLLTYKEWLREVHKDLYLIEWN